MIFCVKPLLHFCKFLVNFDLKPDYFFGKPMNRRFKRYIVRTEILSTFHARVEYISVKNTPFKPMGTKPPKLSFLLGHVDPIEHTHPSTDPTHHLKRHLGPISRFATIQFQDRPTDRQTDRPIDGIGDNCVPRALTLTLYG